jgi:hypothetical protein
MKNPPVCRSGGLSVFDVISAMLFVGSYLEKEFRYFGRRFLSFSLRDRRFQPCRVASNQPGAIRPASYGYLCLPFGSAKIQNLFERRKYIFKN